MVILLIYKLIQQKQQIKKYANYLFACSKKAGDWLYKNNNYTIINNAVDYDDFIFNEEKRKNEEEVTEDEQHKLELILEQFRQKVLEIEKTYLEKEEEEIAKKKNLTNEIIERMKQKNGCH